MRYFRLFLNDDNKKWKDYEVFGIDFYNGDESISAKNSYPLLSNKDVTLYIKKIKDGIPPDFASIGTKYLIANGAKHKRDDFLYNGLTLFEVSVKNENERYFVLHFDNAIDCVDLKQSEFTEWPKEHVLKPWENPIGQFFLKPTLRFDKIPKDLDCFSLSNWGGPFNQVVSQRVKDKLSILDKDNFLSFNELSVV